MGLKSMEVVVAILFVSIAVCTLVLTPFFLKSRERLRLIELVRAASDNGQPLPPEVLSTLTAEPKQQRPSHIRDIRRGIVLLSAALAVEIFSYFAYLSAFMDEGNHRKAAEVPLVFAGLGALPLCVGLAFLLLGLTGKKSSED